MREDEVVEVVAAGHRLLAEMYQFAQTLTFLDDEGKFLHHSARLKLKVGACLEEISDRLYDLEVAYQGAKRRGEI